MHNKKIIKTLNEGFNHDTLFKFIYGSIDRENITNKNLKINLHFESKNEEFYSKVILGQCTIVISEGEILMKKLILYNKKNFGIIDEIERKINKQISDNTKVFLNLRKCFLNYEMDNLNDLKKLNYAFVKEKQGFLFSYSFGKDNNFDKFYFKKIIIKSLKLEIKLNNYEITEDIISKNEKFRLKFLFFEK